MKIGRFPETVNENAARMVATIVCVLSLINIFEPSFITFIPLVYGFIARVLYGPDYSPAALLVTKGIIPTLKISNKPTPGAPKRFAQFVGVIFSLSAFFLFVMGSTFESQIILGVLAFFAFLEAALGFCAGCFVFGFLIKWKLVPEEVCERCNQLTFNNTNI